ncbi:MAG: PDZ domain-containing protein [Phycisphaerae bacterium]|nr:PDZ domain-containing protein [Gemmatimonadaceae bacterium]
MKKLNPITLGTAAFATAIAASPVATSAQGIITATRSRTAPMNSCVLLKSLPSPLVESPEGLEMLKMQRELGEVRDRLILTKADTSDPALKRVIIARNGVDSMVRFFASGGGPDGNPGTFTVHIRTNSTGPSPAERMIFESMIREMQPRVVEAVRGSQFIGTINVQSTAPGYLGVSTSTSTFPSVLDNTRSFGYCDYPRVETVDAGSPADKAGLSAGDTLLAYNKLDLLQHDVNYQSLLVPGKPLHIKFRRDGQIREVTPTIVPRVEPERVFVPARTSCADPSMRAECEAPQLVTGRPFGFIAQGGTAMPARARPYGAPILFPGPVAGQAVLGGAALQVITEAFARNSGVVAGFLVMSVREGQPAYAAGIREGDVIVAANGTPVRDINGFSNALAPRMSEHVAVLQLSSSAGLRTVTMRWP